MSLKGIPSPALVLDFGDVQECFLDPFGQVAVRHPPEHRAGMLLPPPPTSSAVEIIMYTHGSSRPHPEPPYKRLLVSSPVESQGSLPKSCTHLRVLENRQRRNTHTEINILI